MNPKYPIYIISKGRADTRLTSKALEAMKVPYRIVIEPQEYHDYASVIDTKKILTLPFSNLGQGSIPARNWVWEHSEKEGHERHWILDDNIQCFYRYNKNQIIKVGDASTFCACEVFTDRYSNVHMSGMNYEMFVLRRVATQPPFLLNTRIYSCILLKNGTGYKWRGRYNEDTDLSIRFLKAGFCTILFNAFLAKKTATMKMKGGNTDELYKQDKAMDGRWMMAESLRLQHPDIVTVTRKWNRWQHHVNYKPFAGNALVKRKGVELENRVNNFGMKLYTNV